MIIRSIAHKGLRRFIEHNDNRGLPPAIRKKLSNMLTLLDKITEVEEIHDWKNNFRAHKLVGSRKNTWSLRVTANLRLTFTTNSNHEILDLDLEDYH